ncbi:MAG: F0F1 ATP synthase subunit B [Clostridium sp.]
MNISVGMIIFSTINFLIFYLIMKKFFFEKTLAVIDERKIEVENSFKKASDEEVRAELLKSKYEEDVKRFNNEGMQLVESYKEKADRIYSEIVEESNKEAVNIKEKAVKEIERERAIANKEMKQEIIELSMDLAEKALEREINAKRHKELIDEFIAKVGI